MVSIQGTIQGHPCRTWNPQCHKSRVGYLHDSQQMSAKPHGAQQVLGIGRRRLLWSLSANNPPILNQGIPANNHTSPKIVNQDHDGIRSHTTFGDLQLRRAVRFTKQRNVLLVIPKSLYSVLCNNFQIEKTFSHADTVPGPKPIVICLHI